MFFVLLFALDYNLNLPPWLCQSYVRDSPQEHIDKIEAKKMEMVSFLIHKNFHYWLIFFITFFVFLMIIKYYLHECIIEKCICEKKIRG